MHARHARGAVATAIVANGRESRTLLFSEPAELRILHAGFVRGFFVSARSSCAYTLRA